MLVGSEEMGDQFAENWEAYDWSKFYGIDDFFCLNDCCEPEYDNCSK